MSRITSGPRQHQQVAVVLQVLGVVLEALAAVVGLGQLEALDHRAHGAVEDEDALLEQVRQGLAAGVDDQVSWSADCRNRALTLHIRDNRAILTIALTHPSRSLRLRPPSAARRPTSSTTSSPAATRWCSCPPAAASRCATRSRRIARQRPATASTIVVSPLIALMHDQVGALHEAGVEAAFLNSTLSVRSRPTRSRGACCAASSRCSTRRPSA